MKYLVVCILWKDRQREIDKQTLSEGQSNQGLVCSRAHHETVFLLSVYWLYCQTNELGLPAHQNSKQATVLFYSWYSICRDSFSSDLSYTIRENADLDKAQRNIVFNKQGKILFYQIKNRIKKFNTANPNNYKFNSSDNLLISFYKCGGNFWDHSVYPGIGSS